MTNKIVVISTCGSSEEAQKIARHLVEKRLAACATIIPGAKSIYHWEGKTEESEEWLVMIKTSQDLFESLKAELQSIHSYQTPEIIAVPILAGLESYLAWMDRELEQV
jgi:periplasmic divalent cation tolerance protein